jgi:acyl-CoA synthetase (NDP forming)
MTDTTRGWLSGLATHGAPDEYETKRLLAAHGLITPRGIRLGAEAAAACAEPRPGFDPPYVVKVCSPGIPHKTDSGGVLFSIDGPGLPAAVRGMADRFPGCGVLVEEQVRFIGNELIIGAFRDPGFGPAVMVGAGGILTELYKDVAFRLVPCEREEALRMLRELKVFPVLEGFRGLRMDAPGLADVIARVSMVVDDLGDSFGQLDINPIVFASADVRPGTEADTAPPGRWTVLDAKLVFSR